jgi:putative endonuclease
VPDWFVYVLRCGDGSLYTGITTDVTRRLTEHASGGPKAAKYLRGRGPLQLAFSAPVDGKSAALSMERWIKAQSKSRKEELVAGRLRWPDSD